MTMFSDGIPDVNIKIEGRPNEYKTKKCEDCLRCEESWKEKGKYWCPVKNMKQIKHIDPKHNACDKYMSKERYEEKKKREEELEEKRRKELWEIYSKKDPIKLPIVFDGYGNIPMCPVCGEMPYDTEQCHWCGQRFIQDDPELQEYENHPEVRMDCPICGGKNTMVGARSNYNGHFHGFCEKCGVRMME